MSSSLRKSKHLPFWIEVYNYFRKKNSNNASDEVKYSGSGDQLKNRCRLKEVIFEDCDFENGYKKSKNSLQIIVDALNGVRIFKKKLKSITIYESDAQISKALAKRFKKNEKVKVNP